MSNLTQSYANLVGVPLPPTQPDIPSCYFPIPDKYLVVSTFGDENGKKYLHWNIVFDLIGPHLQKHEYSLIQIGNKDDLHIRHAIDHRGLSFRQNCFVIENGDVVCGNDSYLLQIAGYKKVPIVAAISADHVEVSKPQYIGDHVYIESHRECRKPSYGLDSRDINLIRPEELGQAILNILNIDYQIPLKTIRIGSDFYVNQLDFLNDYPIEGDVFKDKNIISRMDLFHNPQALAQCLYFYKAGIITAKPISFQLLQKFKDKIHFIVILIEKGYSKGFIESVNKLGVPYTLISELEGRDLTDAKLDLFDFNPVLQKKKIDKTGIDANVIFRTNRLFLSNQKMYASAYHWRIQKPFDGNHETVGYAVESSDFEESIESSYFFRLKQ